MTSHPPRRWLCAAALAALALPMGAAQPQAWAPHSSDAPWGGGGAIAAGGSGRSVPAPAFRSVEFEEATCRQLAAALPLSFTIPSSYAIRAESRGAAAGECLWGTTADLERVLRDPPAADFKGLQDGVFRSQITGELHYDRRTRKFTPDGGALLANWRQHPRWAGYANLHLTEEERGGQPVLRLVADAPGGAGRVYRLYLGGATERDVLVISYHPSGRGQAADDATWARFVEGIQRTKTATPTT